MEVHTLKNSYCNVILRAVEESHLKLILSILLIAYSFQPLHAQILAEPDCPDAYTICDASQSYYFEVNGSGSIDDANGSLVLFCQSQTSADQFESSSAWFTFTPKYSGTFGFYVLPEVEEDWEYMLFGNIPDCNDLHNMDYHLVCNSFPPESPSNFYTGIGVHPTIGGPPGTVQGFEDYVNVNAGEQYILFITPFVFDGNSIRRATLTFQGGLIETHGADAFEQLPACTLSVGEFNFNEKVQVYPNPVIDELNIKSNTAFTKVEFYDLTGKKIIEQDYSKNIDFSQLVNGVYILKLFALNGSVVIKKVVKK